MKNLFSPSLILCATADNGSEKVSLANQNSTMLWRVAFLFAALLLMAGTSFAQVQLPSEDRCTSKDLSLVSARLDVPACQTCADGTSITKPLLLAINNTTSSTRTSFAFWGTITIKEGSTTVYSASITGCEGPILKNQIKEYTFDELSTTSTIITDVDGSGELVSLMV